MDQHVGAPMAKRPGIAVRIADRDRRDPPGMILRVLVAVADALAGRQLLYLRDDRPQRADLLQLSAERIAAVDSVQPKAEPHHVVMQLRVPGDARRIAE